MDYGTLQWSNTVYQTIRPESGYMERCTRYDDYHLIVE
jgi:hypothetical protein